MSLTLCTVLLLALRDSGVPRTDREHRRMLEQGKLYSTINQVVAKSRSATGATDDEVVFLYASYDVVFTVTGNVNRDLGVDLIYVQDRGLAKRMEALASRGPYEAATYLRYLSRAIYGGPSASVVKRLLPIAERDKECASWVRFWRARQIEDDRKRLAALWKAGPPPGRTTWEHDWTGEVMSVCARLKDGASIRRLREYIFQQARDFPNNEVFRKKAAAARKWAAQADWVER